MAQSSKFELFIMSFILLNTIFLCLEYHNAPKDYRMVLSTGNNIFVVIFTLEAVIKLIALGFKNYWRVEWNKFDLVIVIFSLISLYEGLFNFNVTALRIIRVARIFKMIKTSKGLRYLLKTLYISLANIINVGMLLFLVFFTFAVAGMDLFGEVEDGEFINEDANFRTFYVSMMTLFRASTGESWNGLMHDCLPKAGLLSPLFWLLFVFMAFFIFLNVFVAVIYENFNDILSQDNVAEEQMTIKRKHIKEF